MIQPDRENKALFFAYPGSPWEPDLDENINGLWLINSKRNRLGRLWCSR